MIIQRLAGFELATKYTLLIAMLPSVLYDTCVSRAQLAETNRDNYDTSVSNVPIIGCSQHQASWEADTVFETKDTHIPLSSEARWYPMDTVRQGHIVYLNSDVLDPILRAPQFGGRGGLHVVDDMVIILGRLLQVPNLFWRWTSNSARAVAFFFSFFTTKSLHGCWWLDTSDKRWSSLRKGTGMVSKMILILERCREFGVSDGKLGMREFTFWLIFVKHVCQFVDLSTDTMGAQSESYIGLIAVL